MTKNKKSPHICWICGDKGEFELDDGQWICWICTQIQGELAQMSN